VEKVLVGLLVLFGFGLLVALAYIWVLLGELSVERQVNRELAENLAEFEMLWIKVEDLNSRLNYCYEDLDECRYDKEFYKNRYEFLRKYVDVLAGGAVAVTHTVFFYTVMRVSPSDLNCDVVLENYATDYGYLDDYESFLREYRATIVDMGILSDSDVDEEIAWAKTLKSWLAAAYNFCTVPHDGKRDI